MPCSLVSMEQAAKKSVTNSQNHLLMTRRATLGLCFGGWLPLPLRNKAALAPASTSSPFHLMDVKIAAVNEERKAGNEVAVELMTLPWLLLLLHLLLAIADRTLVDCVRIS